MARRGTWRAVALTLGLAAPLGVDPLLAAPGPSALPAPQGGGAIQLKVRRQADAVELVVEGTGAGPQLQQSSNANGWLGQLVTSAPGGLRLGPQRLTIPELGFQSVSLEGSGTTYRLTVTPMQGVPLGRPVVSADGRNLIISFPASPQLSSTTARFDITQPGRIPGQSVAPPLQPRAVAPPLGDIAVGTMVLRNQSFVRVSGPRVTLNLRNAPAIDALMALARMGGYGFVYVDDSAVSATAQSTSSGSANSSGVGRAQVNTSGASVASSGAASGASSGAASVAMVNQGVPVTLSFFAEDYSRVLNSILLAANLQGRLDGRTIFVGPSVLGKSFGSQVSKIYRLNQASSASAADYLASLGASITKVNVITNSVTQGATQASQVSGGSASQQTTSQNITTTETYGAATGPLRGLTGTTDSRLQTITLVGDSQLVAVAENYLRQIDLRQRQVALSVRILDVSLDNDAQISNSFAFRYGNNFIVSDEGRLVGAFNSRLPPGTVADSTLPPPGFNAIAAGAAPANNPGLSYAPNNFYDFVRASIQSTSTKVLASPTLILSENSEEIKGGAETAAQLSAGSGTASGNVGSASIGRPRANEAFVTVGEQVITNYTVTTGTQGNGNSCQPQFGIAGLTFGARVSRIDDNGFVTFTLSPQITAVTRKIPNIVNCGPVDILAVRRLDTGSSRVRDGQTLILTGVISDADQQEITKWPILGDIPLIGQFFRGSNGRRSKRELVIMVTPRILEDGQGGGYGYGFQPSTREARQMLGG